MLVVRRILALLLLCLFTFVARAEELELKWVRGSGGFGIDQATGIAVDGEGNVYTTGIFSGDVDFDPGEGTFILSNVARGDIFVQKLDASGNFVWARGIGWTRDDWGWGIAVDGAGNVYTTGSFEGTVDFDPSAGTLNLTSAGQCDIFVHKLDASGNLVWARRMGGKRSDEGRSIVLDGEGNIYTTGYFEGTADFDPGEGTMNLTNIGQSNTFVQKLDKNGTLLWARGMYGWNPGQGSDIAVDSMGNVYTTGEFSGTVDFDSGEGTFNLTSAGLDDIFVQKLDASGTLIWARGMGGTEYDQGYEITVDGAGNIYATGSFRNIADFDPGANTVNLRSAGIDDIFVLKLDASGALVWVRGIGGRSSDMGNSIAVNGAGNIYTTGAFQDTVDFDPATGTVNLTSTRLDDIFVLKLDGSGALVWARGMGGRSSDKGNGIAVDDAGNVYTTGFFEGTAIFDPGAGTLDLNSAGNSDIFVLKLGPDLVPPNATNIAPGFVGPTNSDSVDFTVSFDEEVQSFDSAEDLEMGYLGTAGTGATISGGPMVYTVMISGISGDGSFTLAINTQSDVQDLAGNALATSVTSAAVVIDNTPPTVSIGAPSVSLVNSGATTTFPVSVDGADIISLTSESVTINHRGTSGGSVVVVDGTSATPAVQVNGVNGDGSYSISLAAGIAVDAAGNTSIGVGPSAVVRVDNTTPMVSISEPVGSPVNRNGTATFPVTVGGSGRIDLNSASVVIDHNGTAGGRVVVLDRMTVMPRVQVRGVTGDGSYRIGIAAGVAADAAGNASPSTGPSVAVRVDNRGPEFGNVVASPAEVSVGDTVSIGFDSSEPVVGEPEVKVNGNPATRLSKADFAYEYTVQSRDVLGAATITISGADALGNVGALGDSTLLDIVRAEREGSVEGEGEGGAEGLSEGVVEGEGTQDGEGEGVVEGAGEGEGEGENPPAGCGGCNAAGGPMAKSLGDWLAVFFGFAVLLGAHLSLRSRQTA